MKNTNRQTSPLGRSTKEENAGLSLLRPRLIEIIGDNYVYFNEILRNIYTTAFNCTFKTASSFLSRLSRKKFPRSTFMYTGSKFRIRFDSHISTRWFKFSFVPKNSLASTVDFSF